MVKFDPCLNSINIISQTKLFTECFKRFMDHNEHIEERKSKTNKENNEMHETTTNYLTEEVDAISRTTKDVKVKQFEGYFTKS